ncbi:MAG: HAD-IIIC family phosphatase [Oscillospiraceae bacterium]
MDVLTYPFDSLELMKKRRAIKRRLLAENPPQTTKRIAVLGGSTTNDIAAMLELFLLDNGIGAQFWQSEYARYWQDAMFGNEELDAFRPDIIYIHTSLRNLGAQLNVRMTAEEVDALLEERFSHFREMWEKLSAQFGCVIIQNNFELPFYRLLGNFEATDPRGTVNFLTRLNQKFYEYAQAHTGFYIQDLNYLSARYGLEKWHAPHAWYMYKYAMSLEAIPELAFNLSNIIKSIFGKNKKALALDLDNTLWGGVVGDDGVEGIEIGEETATGEAYLAFQEYLRAYQDIGVLLTVCSKNDEENALVGLNHPASRLKPGDFVSIKANWENKDLNIAQIAAELEILPESIVFVDDNPAERAIVHAQLPETGIVTMTTPEEYIANVDRCGYFEVTTLSGDDLGRTDMYVRNARRKAESRQFADYGDYLKSLSMHAEIRDFEPVYLSRITQLTNKSNQFNLTTKRYTQAEMEETFISPAHIRLYGKLADKFGDNGIVSVVIGKIRDDAPVLDIELWLMSCRVLKRDMEFAMLDTLVSQAKARGIERLVGYYYRTKKNNMVSGLYGVFGFSPVSENEAGDTVWTLELADYRSRNAVIRVNEEDTNESE